MSTRASVRLLPSPGFREPPRSGTSGDCIEAATALEGSAVRDAWHREAGAPFFGRAEWVALLVGVRFER
ncbi:DUF397 domain-containing protein [Nocardiopsis changdeensis]|uniref:DUF397 domain-containing protein n=2 Tax=Nocardiopsidaceae TaxID=83676 RepID=A0ABX8BH31_9ACTN|nr:MULTISPECIES: DUF397 domain-containing protein [Nocardiopsis]QUX21085.1 DUF397 domain-containing protein [Nocardiopsis changdeensis]QYX37015.1 DUF397 domain-containing protein [Nocardiopsis sp. MT53]